jgi:HPt (histidine-containing phosphotransfer) domain-containing protein
LEHSADCANIGVDIASAIGLYPNGAACVSVLRSFVANTPLLLEKMSSHLNSSHLSSSLPDYVIAVHGLKGACNSICARESAAFAKDMEFAGKEGKLDYVRSRHAELQRRVHLVTEGLEALLAEWETARPAEGKELRSEPDKHLLGRLSAAADKCRSDLILEILDELEKYRYEKGEDLVRWLREQAENLEYGAIYKRMQEENL